jgi:hypothetical protein
LLETPPVSHAQSHFWYNQGESSASAAVVRSKLEDGNIIAVVRIYVQTINRLRTTKPHRTHYGDDILLLLPTAAICQTRLHILRCRRRNMTSSFPVDSSAGPDGLRPQHLLDLIYCQEAGHALVMAITALVNLLLQGWCPSEVTTVLFGGKLLTLKNNPLTSATRGAVSRQNVQTITRYHDLKTSCCLFS